MGETDTPWGSEELIMSTAASFSAEHGSLALRRLRIDADEMTTVHRHRHVNKVVFVEEGLIELQVDDDVVELGDGDAHFIEAGTAHQLQNVDSRVAEILEIGFPFDPDDEVVEDDPYA